MTELEKEVAVRICSRMFGPCKCGGASPCDQPLSYARAVLSRLKELDRLK
jgi:hypothetical protein